MGIIALIIAILGVGTGIYYGEDTKESNERGKLQLEHSIAESSFNSYQERLHRYSAMLISEQVELTKKLNKNKCPHFLSACNYENRNYDKALEIFASQGQEPTCSYLLSIGYFEQHEEEQYLFSSSKFTFSMSEVDNALSSFKAIKITYSVNKELKIRWIKSLKKQREDLLRQKNALLVNSKKYSKAKVIIDRYLLNCEVSLKSCNEKNMNLYNKVQDLFNYDRIKCNLEQLLH